MRKTLLLAAVLAVAACAPKFDPSKVADAAPGQLVKVEPPCWWSGMKNSLQLMVNGPEISRYSVSVEGLKGVRVSGIHKADSPNYLFVDVNVASGVEGDCWLVFSENGAPAMKAPYHIGRKASIARESFGTADMIYLIFPDRFANGDPSNDRIAGMNDPDGRENYLGRHGGDIQGIIDHLDYIEGLGATAVWLTPVLEDNQDFESYHGYAVTDHYAVDPRFGSNALYQEMVRQAHSRGLKVIMDIVTNHCGTFHWMMKDLPFADWINQWPEYTNMNAAFSTNFDPNASQYDLALQEGGWFVPMMPDMNLDNPFTLKYLQQWALWWIEFSGLDGLRVDTYPYNEKEPMSRWCQAVLADYPWMNIVGECWTSTADQLAYWQGGNANPDGFDSHLPSIMDFPLEEAVVAGLCEDGDENMWGRGLTRVYEALSHDATYHDLSRMMTFLANHDHNRLGDTFGGNPDKMRMALGLLATVRGIPQLYNGDEMLFSRAYDNWHDGSKRADFPGGWTADASVPDLFTAEGRSLDYNAPAPYPRSVSPELHDYTARLFRWRRDTPVLHNGRTMHFLTRDNTYAFFRYDGRDTVFVYVNNSSEARTIPWDHYAEISAGLGEGTDIVTGEKVNPSAGLSVAPQSILIVEF
mgnify:FL=1